MKLCWEHDPSKRPKISQVAEWCNIPEFESLRAVYHLEKGKMTALCQCQVDHNCAHSLAAYIIDASKVKLTITPYTEDDPLLCFPVLSPPKKDHLIPHKGDNDQKERILKFEMEKPMLYCQIWMVQKTDKGTSQLQIFSYNDSRIGYSVSVQSAQKYESMLNVEFFTIGVFNYNQDCSNTSYGKCRPVHVDIYSRL